MKATEAHPECDTYWNTLGAVQYRAGHVESAITTLEHAIALAQGATAFDHFFLAMAHAQLGNGERAQHCFLEATLWMEQHAAGLRRPPLSARRSRGRRAFNRRELRRPMLMKRFDQLRAATDAK